MATGTMDGPPEVMGQLHKLPSLLGPILIGTILGGCACGILINQVLSYTASFPADRRFNQFTVAGLTFISLAAFGNSLALSYYSFIEVPGLLATDPAALSGLGPSYIAPLTVATPGAATILSQSFFSLRAAKLAPKSPILSVVLPALCLLHLAATVATVIWSCLPAHAPRATDVVPASLKQIAAVSLSIGAVVDIAITSCLVVILRRSRSASRSSSGSLGVRDTLIARVLHMTLTTGGMTALLQTATAISLVLAAKGRGGENEGLGLVLLLPHLTSLGVLSTLNWRDSGRTQTVVLPPSVQTLPASTFRGDGPASSYELVVNKTPTSPRFTSSMEKTRAPSPLDGDLVDDAMLHPRAALREPRPSRDRSDSGVPFPSS